MDINAVNSLPNEEFVGVFCNVVEKCPIVAGAVCHQRPFDGLSAFEAAIADFIDSLPESGKLGLLRCLPDLAGRALQSGTLSPDSRMEQAQAGLYALKSDESARMAQLNGDYKAKFGFPFIICARRNDKASILEQMGERFPNEYEVERDRAIQEVKKIGSLRLRLLVLADAEDVKM